MALTLEEVQRIAQLARVAINEAEAQEVLSQINDILGLIARMQAVDTRGVEPMSHVLEVTQRLREDAVTEGDQRAAFQALAPHVEGGLYLVPKVIE
ncbi:MAG TPA: Asp-tRNA(Asn)/Glu-tRNA(Gln) amidotransferase subunit GatC [Burkholderiales bacterium]|nr:Asp-tRNA(Asn)/Glu-tRNA(Gln) amidotransferase subunit GatC [Burkholderiales bacterium]